jgi:hypothetical protein
MPEWKRSILRSNGRARNSPRARACLGAVLLAGIPTLAHAVDLPDPFTFDAGPLGTLRLSGGADGYGYALTGAGDELSKGLLGTSTSVGLEFLNGLIKLDKPDGLVRFTVEAGAVNSLVLGTRPRPPTVQKWSTGPFRSAYLTLAPTPNLTISAGQVPSLEGFESSIDWKNFNIMLTSMWDVENSQSLRDLHLRSLHRCGGVQRWFRYECLELSATLGIVRHRRQQPGNAVRRHQSRLHGSWRALLR